MTLAIGTRVRIGWEWTGTVTDITRSAKNGHRNEYEVTLDPQHVRPGLLGRLGTGHVDIPFSTMGAGLRSGEVEIIDA